MLARAIGNWPGGLFRWYHSSITNRIVAMTMLLSMVAVLVIGLAAYASLSSLLEESVEARLDAMARLGAQRIEDRLERVQGELVNLAGSSLVSNAIIDSEGRGSYLSPLLREYRQTHHDVLEIGLFDSQGQPLAGSGETMHDHAELAARAVSKARIMFNLTMGEGRWILHMAAPVRLHGTNSIEGVLVSDIDLRRMASETLTEAASGVVIRVQDGWGRAIFTPRGYPNEMQMRERALPLEGEGTLNSVGRLWVVAAIPEAQAGLPVNRLRWLFLAVVGLALAMSYWLGRFLARRITSPLVELSDQARNIAREGVAGARPLDVRVLDEIGWLGQSFNTMLRSLQERYDELEERVRQRTAEVMRRELYLRAILDNFPFMVWLKDGESRFLAVNKVMSDACGQDSPEAMANLTDLDVWPEDLARRYREDDARVMESRREKVVEEPIEEDGQRWWYETFKKPVIDDRGRVLGTVGFARDITERKEAEQALVLRDRAIMSTSDGIVIVDMLLPGRAVMFCNPAFERITGYSAPEIRELGIRVMHRDDVDQQGLRDLQRCIAERCGCRVVLRNYRKDGTLFWNELTVSPVHDENGLVTSYVGVIHDITASVEANAALAASERRLALSLDALRDGLWDWNIEDNSLYQSPSWATMLGFRPEELTGRLDSYLRCLPEDQRDQVLGAVQAHMDGKTESFVSEHRMLRKDGSEIWVSDRGRVVEWTREGRPARMIGTITDISERHRAEGEIRNLIQRLDLVLNMSSEAYVYFDRSQRVALANPACERFVGMTSASLRGLHLDDFRARLRQLADPGQPFPMLFVDEWGSEESGGPARPYIYLRLPESRVLSWEWRRGSLDDNGVLYLRDVTRETEVDRMKSEFLSAAAHELRTPMASIMGFSELLLYRDYDPETVRNFLDTIHHQSSRLTNLLNELLDLARIEARAGKDFDIRPRPLAEILGKCSAAMSGHDGGREVRLEIGDNLPLVMMDAAKMQQAVVNVLSNAFKYSPSGGEVSLRAYAEGDDVYIEVEDHGIGMKPEQVARVFERFYRADPSGSIPGTGLGMSLTKEIVDVHMGTITVNSAPDEGTTVTIRLPAAPAFEMSDREG